MSKEIEHVQFVSTCRKDEKIVRHVSKNGNMSNGNIRHVEATFDMLRHVEFDMLLRHVAGVDGALDSSEAPATDHGKITFMSDPNLSEDTQSRETASAFQRVDSSEVATRMRSEHIP